MDYAPSATNPDLANAGGSSPSPFGTRHVTPVHRPSADDAATPVIRRLGESAANDTAKPGARLRSRHRVDCPDVDGGELT